MPVSVIALRATPFQKQFLLWKSFYLPNLRKKVFSGAALKCFFLCGLNNSDSVVFENSAFREIKNHSLMTIPFQKCFPPCKF